MATDDAPPGTYAKDLARLDKATAAVKEARAALATAEAKATAAVAAALQSCLAEGRNRTEVQQHSPFSPPTVRKIGEDAGIPPDERYVRSIKSAANPLHALTIAPPEPPVARPEPAPTPPQESRVARLSREGEFLAFAADLTPEREAELKELMYQRNDAWFNMTYRAGMSDKELIRRGIKDGKLTASDLRN